MKFRSVLLLSAALLLLAVSCKDKTEEDITYLSFVGSPEFSLPTFLGVGEEFTLTPANVSRAASDTKTALPGCYWTISQLDIRDTVRHEGDPASVPYTFTFEVPDSLRTITVLCAIFAEGYTNASVSTSCIIVRSQDGYRSIQGIQYPEKSFTDPRDGHSYHYTQKNGLDWMAENLSFADAGLSYFDCEVMDGLFGRYYTWKEAAAACPDGWRLPTNAEFMAFNNAYATLPASVPNTTFQTGAGTHMANAYFNATRMWEYWPDVTPTNASGLSLMPLGYVSIRGESHSQLDQFKYSLFWTADELNEEQAYFRSIYMKYDTISCEAGYKDYMALNTRCVRDSQD
ncbi:MAG: hypothetical protein IJ654_07950 [Bacteroidales bacterium]|nr:hypothetical protein [Bacteroidales bacterium]